MENSLTRFQQHLKQEERCTGTIEKYLHDVGLFLRFLGPTPLAKESVIAWKEQLLQSGRTVSTVNSMLTAVNQYLRFLGLESCRVRVCRQQRQAFRSSSRELTKAEYLRLVEAAGQLHRTRLQLLLQAICATGIRVSEVRYLTVEAAKTGRSNILSKGKVRTILLPSQLCRRLLQYAKQKKIASGEIFLTRSGQSLSRKQIWAEMKSLCRHAHVEASKVFPHNLRHLFATVFYAASHDIVKLADVLGHSSVETTRIYLTTCGIEHMRHLERLELLVC